jgi:hypothetical protein
MHGTMFLGADTLVGQKPMKRAKVSFAHFCQIAPTEVNGFGECPTFVYVKNGRSILVQKMDETEEMGYSYRISLARDGCLLHREDGWFDGFGNEDRPNDVIHAIRKIV